MRGTFISIDGIDGAGKSALFPVLEEVLENHGISYVTTREPGGTRPGELIRDILLMEDLAAETELLLFFASRAELLRNVIEPALAQGKWVLSDRFVDASFAYQGAGRELGQECVQELADWLLPKETHPDRVFILDVDVATALERVHARIDKQSVSADRFEQERADRTAFLKEHGSAIWNAPGRIQRVTGSSVRQGLWRNPGPS